MSEETVDILDRMEAARRLVCDIAAGRKDWTMEIPANPRSDTDLVLTYALRDGKAEIERLRRLLSAATEKIVALKDHVEYLNAGIHAASERIARLEAELTTARRDALQEATNLVCPYCKQGKYVQRGFISHRNVRTNTEWWYHGDTELDCRLCRASGIHDVLAAQNASEV